MATNTPTPKSYEQILSEMISAYTSKIGVNDLNVGGVMLSFMEADAQTVYRALADNFAYLRDTSVDQASEEALRRIAADENVKIESARVATGRVTFRDSSFEKIATKIYAGSPAPNIGSTVIRLSDASLFPSTGVIYIGRGTPNIEGPLPYINVSQVGSFYEITLSSPTTKFHNISESVVLGQGGVRNIPVGTTVRSPASGAASSIEFSVNQQAVLLDGENEVKGVLVASRETGSQGNVPRGAIREVVTPIFVGASVTNETSFVTGKDDDSQTEIRNKIKRQRLSKGLGTALAIKNATLGIQATDEAARVISNEILNDGQSTTLFIDDGTGYEAKSRGVGLEFIVDSALGGEQNFQLATGGRQTSIVKAFLESTLSQPFNISAGDRLAILVGGKLSEHVFSSTDFRAEGFASAFEVIASINANPELTFTGSTSESGTKVVLTAKEEQGEFLKVTEPTTGNNASIALGFTSNEVETLKLYKNRKKLSRNGRNAQIESENQNDWSNNITSGDTLTLSVDGTAPVTYTFTDADFIAEGTFTSVSKNNSLQSWINVINKKVTGVTASINGARIILSSNLGANSRAAISVDPLSTIVLKGVFTSQRGLEATGFEADYVLSRNTAQFRLLQPLQAGDELTAGTEFTRAEIQSDRILGGTVTLIDDGYQWFLIDSVESEIIPSSYVQDTFVTISKEGNNRVRYTSSVANAASNLQKGDYVIIWSEEFNVNNRFEGRVFDIGTDWFEIRVTDDEYTNALDEALIAFDEGIVFVRSNNAPQKIKIEAGVYDISTIADKYKEELFGVISSTLDDEILIITSTNQSVNGSVHLITQTVPARNLLFEDQKQTSSESQFAFYESETQEGEFPLFAHGEVVVDAVANPPDSTIPSMSTSLDFSDIEPNVLLKMLNPFLSGGVEVKDAQAVNESSQVIEYPAPQTAEIKPSQTIKRLREGDRFFVASPLDFDFNDSFVTIIDGRSQDQTFPVPLYRRAITNSSSPISANNFRAFDVDSGVSSLFQSFFGANYDFSNHKVMMRARNVIDPSSGNDEDAILYRSFVWGRGGESYKIGYFYPTSANSEILHTIVTTNDIEISLFLKSGPEVPNQINGTTEWDVTVTPNTPVAGVDTVTYTWSGVGTNPQMTTLSPDNYITINEFGEFAQGNQGTFKVSAASPTEFSVLMPNGVAENQNDVATLTNETISLYENDDTTAEEIFDYVNENLSDFLEATLLDDNGLSGAGVIDTSTYEDSDFSYERVGLVDGENYILSSTLSNVAPLPEFTLKTPLQLASFDTNTSEAYTFNNGEEVRIIPTTIKQVETLINTLAVSGISTLATVDTSVRDGRLQLTTNVLGSNGSILITGGSGNKSSALIIGQSAKIIDTNLIKLTVPRSQGAGFHAGQIIKVSNSNVQKKFTDINSSTSISVAPNSPAPSLSTITLSGRRDFDLFFGQTHPMFRDLGRAFNVERQGVLTCISWDGITGSDPFMNSTVAFANDNGDISVDYDEFNGVTSYIVESGTRNFSKVQINDLFTISNHSIAENNGTFKVIGVSDDKKTIVVENTDGVDAASETVMSADMSISHEIKEGDVVEILEPFSPLNQGKFTVIRRFEDSIYIENKNSVEERVTVPLNSTALDYDATTQVQVIDNGNMKILWTGVGTHPSLQNAKMGDILELSGNFSANNQGEFMVTNSQQAQNERTRIIIPSALSIVGGQYFYISTPSTDYYVWFNKDGSSVDPNIVGRTGIEVNILTGDTNVTVALAVATEIDSVAGFSASSTSNVVIVDCDDSGEVEDSENINVGGDFFIETLIQGFSSFVECANPDVVAQAPFTLGVGDIVCHKTSMKFTTYEATKQGDVFTVSSNILGASSQGSYFVTEVLDQNRIVVQGSLELNNSISLANSSDEIYVEEEKPYFNYKKIKTTLVDPANPERFCIVLDSDNEFLKINSNGASFIESVGKLNFSTLAKKGLDAYRFHTGLIAETNRYTYGDPRDTTTYPGVSAAGAEIFIREPLPKRIQVSINVRVNTGIPFIRVTEQVRNNIDALINSTGIGQSIAISDIISSVNAIQGVRAVSITSPQYSPASDVIRVSANEKPIIIDSVSDITVSKVV